MSDPVVVDSSVMIAVMNREPDAEHFGRTLAGLRRAIGWPTVLEVRIWCLRNLGNASQPWLDRLLDHPNTQLVNFDAALTELAITAYDRFGKGRHAAQLNYGDCMAYAMARHSNLPLLFKGGDFSKTDIICHPASVVTA
jgi:ribonuclease VapC